MDPKPLTFRRWYGGDMFGSALPQAGHTWSTDGRVLVRRCAVKGKQALAILARTKGGHVRSDGDERAADVVRSARIPERGTVPTDLGTWTRTVGDGRIVAQHVFAAKGRDYTGAIVGALVYESCAVAFLDRHIIHDCKAIICDGGSSFGQLWWMHQGEPQALLMCIRVPDEEGLEEWAARRAVAISGPAVPA